MKNFLLPVILFCASLCCTALEIDPAKAVIVAPGSEKLAAGELQKHLKLITGVEIPIQGKADGQFAFTLGNPPSDAGLQPEEARWQVSRNGVHIYGGPRNGTAFAVYDFLEKQFKVRWIEPGDRGISYPEMKMLKLEETSGHWTPGRLAQRRIRHELFPYNGYPYDMPGQFIIANRGYNSNLPKEMHLTKQEYDAKLKEIRMWHLRMRMGSGLSLSYGHAFTNWWKKYGKTHPEYFSLINGKRGPKNAGMPDTVKMCVSNPELHKQIVEEWRKRNMPKCINICENDWGGYCECPECRKLDMPPAPGAKWDDDLSDRYVYFANKVLELASRHRPDVIATAYAYGVYKNAPRREKVSPQLVLGFVPSKFDLPGAEANYRAWAAAGAKQLFLRPNDHHAISIGLPTGGEKQLFNAFKLGFKYGIIGTDYDSSHNFWSAVGIADFILARAHTHPEDTFEQHEQEYYAGFGKAAEEVGEYYRYWRQNVWDNRIYPDRKEIAKLGLYGNYQRGLMWNIHRYFRLSDFDKTDAILARAAAKQLSGQDRRRVEMLQLANRYFRLFFLACTAKQEEKQKQAAKLLEFRCKHHKDLMFDWNRMATLEGRYGDVAGVAKADRFRSFHGYKSLPLKWFFSPDPGDAGVREKWEAFPIGKIRSLWEPVLTNAGWEKQKNSGMHPKLQKLLENYDGYGYYGLDLRIPPEWKGREIEVYFGAVDESAWVYLNGQKTGERIFRKGTEDWKHPFSIPITRAIDWSKPVQTLVVRVHDSGGMGGIWQPCYLICR